MGNTKKCTKCKEEKSLSEFNKNKSKKDGLGSECRDCCREYHSKYQADPNKRRKAKQKWIKNNPKKSQESKAKYRKNNRKKCQEAVNKWRRRKYAESIDYRLTCAIRGYSSHIKKLMKQKKELSSIEYLGCTIEQLKAHIESQWQDGMTWDNHAHDGWHIDHVVPLDWYIKNSDDPWQANHYTNLRPLWAKENLLKSNKIK